MPRSARHVRSLADNLFSFRVATGSISVLVGIESRDCILRHSCVVELNLFDDFRECFIGIEFCFVTNHEIN
jgi:hypothetical protein